MAKLTATQKKFLKKHGIPLDWLFDASGMRRQQYRETMRQMGKLFAYGATPCRAYGHRLRTRDGNCIECRPSAISFLLRHYTTAFVYVARSENTKLLKIGVSSAMDDRIYMANLESYGGASDWVLLCYAEVENAGSVESEIHALLEPFKVSAEYFHAGEVRQCREVFKCLYCIARDHLEMYASQQGALIVETDNVNMLPEHEAFLFEDET